MFRLLGLHWLSWYRRMVSVETPSAFATSFCSSPRRARKFFSQPPKVSLGLELRGRWFC